MYWIFYLWWSIESIGALYRGFPGSMHSWWDLAVCLYPRTRPVWELCYTGEIFYFPCYNILCQCWGIHLWKSCSILATFIVHTTMTLSSLFFFFTFYFSVMLILLGYITTCVRITESVLDSRFVLLPLLKILL